MDVLFKCDGQELKNVSEFKYLGLIINRANNSPVSMLEKRICKAQIAFNTIRCKARLLGLFNRRVRV
jgi:hypothetical protein